MYHLGKSLWANWTLRPEYAVVIVGLDNAGKTTLLEQLKNIYLREGAKDLSQSKSVPTVGQNISKVPVGRCQIKFWDLGGQQALRPMWEKYFEDSHALVFVVDSTDKARLEDCCAELDRIVASDVLAGIPILMLANKQDREECLEVEDIKEVFNPIAEKMGARDSRVLPVSALDGTGVADAAEWLLSRMERNGELKPPNMV